ncbi:MAG TPA: DnaB-like helicase C-terminal domain-containing protein [bacterium]|nr:DnaB-like helicase C-terminal domain-containing protein [bacterium]
MKLEGFFERIAGGDVVFIGGRPEVGKTTIALMFAEFASKKEQKTLFCSNEWPADQIVDRLADGVVIKDDLRNITELVFVMEESKDIQYFILDYFQLLGISKNIESEMSELKKTAKKKNVAVILMYAFDRRFNWEKGGILQFKLDDFSLEPYADIIGYIVQVMADESREILVVKHPYGKTDT